MLLISVVIFCLTGVFSIIDKNSQFKVKIKSINNTNQVSWNGLHGYLYSEPFSASNTSKSNNSIIIDGIEHVLVNKKNKDWNKITLLEKRFKNMLALKGSKFIYKRDMFWRTWRKVGDTKNKKLIFYKCSNIIKSTCNGCYGGGYWIIEENHIPCPYEIFSMLNEYQICVANYRDLNKIHKSCSHKITFYDLMQSCDNPIITMYRVSKIFTYVTSERNATDICGGREHCHISTFYRIYDDHIIFRLLNSTDHVIYSKIMTKGRKNYACIENCGSHNFTTKNITESDQKMFADVPRNFDDENHNNNTKLLRRRYSKINKKQISLDLSRKNNVTTTLSPCRKLETRVVEYDEENYDYNNNCSEYLEDEVRGRKGIF